MQTWVRVIYVAGITHFRLSTLTDKVQMCQKCPLQRGCGCGGSSEVVTLGEDSEYYHVHLGNSSAQSGLRG